MKKIIGLLAFAVLVACCCDQQPQARSESSGLTCSLNTDLKIQLNTYFQNNPLSIKVTEERTDWVRGIILKKNKVYTDRLSLHLMIYIETGEIEFWRNYWREAPQLDLATSIGAAIFFYPDRGSRNYIRVNMLHIERENVICLPDTVTILGK